MSAGRPTELEAFTLDIEGGVAHVTLARPDSGNRFDRVLCAEMSRLASLLDEDPAVRAVLLDAEGPYFSVGADLETFLAGDRDEFARFIKDATAGLHTGISRLARMDAPVVAAVHALAVGGAVALCAASDFCLAGESAEFYAAYLGIGLVPDGALAGEAAALAGELAEGPTRAYGEVKNLLLSTFDQPLEAQLEQEARAMARMTRTDDGWDAVRAVAGKKRPAFRGR